MLPLSPQQLGDYTLNKSRFCESGRIDLWLLSTRIHDRDRDFYEKTLSDQEIERACRFCFQTDRDRAVVARGGLRWILSSYCGKDPKKIALRTGLNGKPSLFDLTSRIEFNVTHSGDCAAIAITKQAQCGVDIELQRPNVSYKDIAERFFCAREVEWLRQIESGFMRLWTMKEAISKAVGLGLAIPLNEIDVVDVAEGRTSRILLQTSGLESQLLWLKELSLLKGYTASVAAVGVEQSVRLMS